MTTGDKLIAAAARLLDEGGEAAVTLRAVAQVVGVSHNAPYKHFLDRGALLAAVAARDFHVLTRGFAAARGASGEPLARLQRALGFFVAYSVESPARYRLLFNDAGTAAERGELEAAARATFAEFAAIVGECQEAGQLQAVGNVQLATLIYAAVHGLVDLHASGRLREEPGKPGLTGVDEGVALLIGLLAQRDSSSGT